MLLMVFSIDGYFLIYHHSFITTLAVILHKRLNSNMPNKILINLLLFSKIEEKYLQYLIYFLNVSQLKCYKNSLWQQYCPKF